MDLGMEVFTRPSIISGNPVTSEMPITAKPAADKALAVPPVIRVPTPVGKAFGEWNQASFVRNTDQGAHELQNCPLRVVLSVDFPKPRD
jgi:hypothetical protein